jgi:hypothetical protein
MFYGVTTRLVLSLNSGAICALVKFVQVAWLHRLAA